MAFEVFGLPSPAQRSFKKSRTKKAEPLAVDGLEGKFLASRADRLLLSLFGYMPLLLLLLTLMRQATRYFLLVLATVCILAALALLHSGGTPVRLANASLERLCGTAGFSAGVYLDQEKPAANSDDESLSEGELAIGLRVGGLARSWNQHETKFIRGRPGFSAYPPAFVPRKVLMLYDGEVMFQNLYLHNGTFCVCIVR